ncbi:MAG: WXG100 family type VII secretion target [Anaerolineales bacterium]|nr:WXG100 family type VII secretion target [Anaerolineales bacterium]
MIKIDPGEVRSTGRSVSQKKQDLIDVLERVKTLMQTLEQNFQGQRSKAILSEWEGIRSRMPKAFEDLQKLDDLLKRAADQFEEVDMAK